MQLYKGITLMVLGVLVAVLGFTKVVANLGSPGILLFLFGGLVVGLSFVRRPGTEDVASMPLWLRAVNIFISPAEVFKNIRYNPTWLGIVLVTALFSGVYSAAFYERVTPKRIANHTVDKISESGWVPDEQVAKLRGETLEASSGVGARVGNVLSGIAGWGFLTAFLGLILFLAVLAMGGKINYLQAVSVSAFSTFAVVVIQKAMSLLILYLKDPLDVHPIIGQTTLFPDGLAFLVSAAEMPVLYSLLSYMGLLGFYGLWLNASGLQKAGRSVTPTAGWVAAVIPWLIGLSLALVSSVFFGKFLS